MGHPSSFLASGESLGEPNEVDGSWLYYIVNGPGIKNGDDVVLEIPGETEPVVLLDGNPLELRVLGGFGILTTVDLETGQKDEMALSAEDTAQINPGTIYKYASLGGGEEYDDPLLIRDHCEDFALEHEPSLQDVATQLTSVLHLAQ